VLTGSQGKASERLKKKPCHGAGGHRLRPNDLLRIWQPRERALSHVYPAFSQSLPVLIFLLHAAFGATPTLFLICVLLKTFRVRVFDKGPPEVPWFLVWGWVVVCTFS
jgi:hypothetical protein